jgi:phage terminase small subunit
VAREQRFVDEYLIDFNGAHAAIRAGYAKSGAKVQASRLLKREAVAAEIRRRRDLLTDRAQVNAEKIIAGLARIAMADIRRLYDAHGNLRPIHELDDETAASIAGVDVEELTAGRKRIGQVRKVRRWDAVRAWEALARIKGLFKDNLTIGGDFVDRLMRARERAQRMREEGKP